MRSRSSRQRTAPSGGWPPGPGDARALYRPVLLAGGLVAAGLLFQELVTLLVAVLITVILAIPPAALATRLERHRVPRSIGALLGLVLIVGVFGGVMALVIPPVVDQGEQFVDDLPHTVDSAIEQVASITGAEPARVGDELQSALERYLDRPLRLIGPIASVGLGIIVVLTGLVFMLITAYYMAVRPQPLVDSVLRVLPPARRTSGLQVMERLREAWIGWLQGVAIDMLVTGFLLYLGLSILDVEFALLFAVFSAVLVVVPYFGAVLGGIPPVLFALTESPGKALLVLAIYLLVQQIEGNVIVPLVMSQRVKLHPAAIAIGVVVVGQLVGVIGLVVAVPLISTAVILTEELWIKPRERDTPT